MANLRGAGDWVVTEFLNNKVPDICVLIYWMAWELHEALRPRLHCQLLKAKGPSGGMHIVVALRDVSRTGEAPFVFKEHGCGVFV